TFRYLSVDEQLCRRSGMDWRAGAPVGNALGGQPICFALRLPGYSCGKNAGHKYDAQPGGDEDNSAKPSDPQSPRGVSSKPRRRSVGTEFGGLSGGFEYEYLGCEPKLS